MPANRETATCDRIVRVIEEVSGEASGRAAAHMFRTWALAEGLLAEES